MRRLAALATALAAALVLALAADARPALAHHEENSVMQFANPYGGAYAPTALNWVVRKWWAGQSNSVTYKADATTAYDPYAGGRLDYVVPLVLADYAGLKGGEVGRLHWTPTTGTADIEFKWTAGGDCPGGAAACFDPAWTYYATEDAYYITSGKVWVTFDIPRTANALRATVAHETGHIYGRADQYSHDGANPFLGQTATIINGGYWDVSGRYGAGSYCPPNHSACEVGIWQPGTNSPPIHGPQTEDGDTIAAYWHGKPAWYAGGYYSRHNGVAFGYAVHRYTDNPFHVAFVWIDYSWAERIVVLWWEKETSPGVWTSQTQWLSDTRIGRHYDYSPSGYTNWYDAYLTAYGAGNYRACALPIFVGMSSDPGGEFGDVTQCSTPQYVGP